MPDYPSAVSTAKMIVVDRGVPHAALRIGLGAVFVYAGVVKLQDPLAFADSIASFRILPNVFVAPLALGLPVFEIIAGLIMVTGWRLRTAALAILISMAIFTAALVSALMRGIVVDCGCFGSSIPTVARMWVDLGRDTLLIIATLLVYLPTVRNRPPDAVSP